jgi:hypothetical protein
LEETVSDAISMPKLQDTFVQVDNIKGFRYLDLTGQVLNRISHNYRQYGVDPILGCILTIPTSPDFPTQIRFSSGQIWLHYQGENSAARAVDTAYEWIQGIAQDIEVSSFKRFGMRCLYFVELEQFVRDSGLLLDSLSSDIIRSQIKVHEKEDIDIGLHFRTPIEGMVARISVDTIRLTRVQASEQSQDERDGFMFDVDVYRSGQFAGIPRGEVKELMKNAKKYIEHFLVESAYRLVSLIPPRR